MDRMTDQDAASLQRDLRRLYSRDEFSAALDLLDRHPEMFELQPAMLYHWRMCVAARAGAETRAIGAFSDGLAHGYAYPASLIHEDGDLASLQGIPAFQELARLSLGRFADAERETRPELIVVPPRGRRAGQVPLLVALHGNSQNARMAARDWSPIVDKGWVLACAQSTQVLTSEAYVWNNLERGATDVGSLYGTLAVGGAVDPERVVVGGFSMGGGLAIQLAVTRAIEARGFIAVAPYLPDPESLRADLDAAAAAGLRGYVLVGLEETTEGLERIRTLTAFLNAGGVRCELEERPRLAHAVPGDLDQVLDRALAFLQ